MSTLKIWSQSRLHFDFGDLSILNLVCNTHLSAPNTLDSALFSLVRIRHPYPLRFLYNNSIFAVLTDMTNLFQYISRCSGP